VASAGPHPFLHPIPLESPAIALGFLAFGARPVTEYSPSPK
jgi:hypothetical protein